MIEKPYLRLEEIWKENIIEQHTALLEQDCAQFFRSQGDPVAEGVASWAPCCFCGGESFLTLFHQHAYRWERCLSCGLLQKRPRPHMQAMSRFYSEGKAVPFFEENVLQPGRETREKKIFAPYLDRLVPLLEEHNLMGGVLLDIGSSSGLFLAAAQKRGLFSSYSGVEPNEPSAADACKAGFQIYRAMFEDADLPPESYDVLTCFSMIQFVQDPVTFLRKCKQILRPRGLVIFTSPNGWAPDILLLREFSPVLPCHTLQLPDPESFKRLCSRVGLSGVYAEAIGQLDVQLVRETWQKSPPDLNHPWADFLYRLFVQPLKDRLAADFQTLLQQHNLSGHLWLQACNDPK
jgi:2-polyprenyl-3-methyl-5-hydroxy-6-metoxy-1,4-benzoquinol methylase